MGNAVVHSGHALSLSARRAWIEMMMPRKKPKSLAVALRKESVDRNRCSCKRSIACIKVALRKESVDRNDGRFATVHNAEIVALRKESVDRNQ